MHESLAWLRDPETEPALGVLLCGLIRDIRLILVHPDLGNAGKLGAITQAVDQLAPAPGPEASIAPAAALVAALLASGTGTATALFEELAGEQIRIELTSSSDRPLTAAECLELRISPGTHGHQRTGMLRTANSGMVAAEVSSLVVPARLPADARRALGIPGPDDPAPLPSGIPLGQVLSGFGVHREPLGARMVRDSTRISGSRVSVESSARMWLDGVPVALASERVTAEFCQQARTRLGSVRAAAVPEQRASSRAARRPGRRENKAPTARPAEIGHGPASHQRPPSPARIPSSGWTNPREQGGPVVRTRYTSATQPTTKINSSQGPAGE